MPSSFAIFYMDELFGSDAFGLNGCNIFLLKKIKNFQFKRLISEAAGGLLCAILAGVTFCVASLPKEVSR
jgi:hypothetical protein